MTDPCSPAMFLSHEALNVFILTHSKNWIGRSQALAVYQLAADIATVDLQIR